MQSLNLDAFRTQLNSLMTNAARQVQVQLHPTDIAFSVRGGCVVAAALIAPPNDVPIEESEKVFLLYLSLPEGHAMATKIPSGCYTVERIPEQKNPRARLVNLEGKAVMELPLNIVKTELPPTYGWEPTDIPAKEPVTHVQATIEQSQASLYRDIVIEGHGTICYPRAGVWYWTWVVIVIVTRAA